MTHTYETAGVFTATVTATDPGGRFWTDTVSVRVRPQASPPVECTDPGSEPGPDDEFDGDRLDGCRWERRAARLPRLPREGRAAADRHDADRPVRHPEQRAEPDAPGAGRTRTGRSRRRSIAPLYEQWHQAAIIVYLSDATFLKFGLVAVSEPGANPPERKIEIRHEVDEVFQPDFPEVLVPRTPGDVYWLRLQKRGDEYRGFYSIDGSTYRELVARPGGQQGARRRRVGVYAFGSRTSHTTVGFDHFHLVESSGRRRDRARDDRDARPGGARRRERVVRVAGRGRARTRRRGLGRRRNRVPRWTGARGPRTAEPFTVGGDGEHLVEFRSTDSAGNVEEVGSVRR